MKEYKKRVRRCRRTQCEAQNLLALALFIPLTNGEGGLSVLSLVCSWVGSFILFLVSVVLLSTAGPDLKITEEFISLCLFHAPQQQ